jgi:hypothetical protein
MAVTALKPNSGVSRSLTRKNSDEICLGQNTHELSALDNREATYLPLQQNVRSLNQRRVGTEMYRTHWALKDADLVPVLMEAGLIDGEAVNSQPPDSKVITLGPITTNTGATAGWPEPRRLNAAAQLLLQSQTFSHIAGANTATPYFRPQLPHELEFATDT